LGKITTYTYDGKGNLLTRTSPDSKMITYSYDLSNRLTQTQYTGGAVTTFQYDDAGNITAAGNAAISYAMTYDVNNRITQITDSNTRAIQYQYDADGNRTQMTTPDGRTFTYAYDNNSRLAQMSAPLGNFTFAYDAANRRTTKAYPNGTSSTYSYNAPNRLLWIQTTKGATAIDAVAYTYDPAGNRLTKATPQESWTFVYDDIYRLTQATPTGGVHQTETYTYDAVGNRLSSEEAHPPTGSETQNYTYDAENRLTGVQVIKDGNTRELVLAYDPFGRRIAKTIVRDEIGTECLSPNVCPRTVHYVYDGESIILEYDQSGEVQTRYTHGPGIDEPLAVEIRNGAIYTPYFYHADGLGSITALSDSQGAVVQRYEYDTFGNPTITTQGNITQTYTFTGREYDAETGMYFYRARYYDPKFGRFVTKDPIGFAGGDINLYGYVLNDPINSNDPRGLQTYICTRPLKKTPFCVGPLCHSYVCTGNAKDGYSCKGLIPTGKSSDSPGKYETDEYSPNKCEKKQDRDSCVEECIQERFKETPPNYSYNLKHGENCHTDSNAMVSYCQTKCKRGHQ
jgi:RHS repeat-associated protein